MNKLMDVMIESDLVAMEKEYTKSKVVDLNPNEKALEIIRHTLIENSFIEKCVEMVWNLRTGKNATLDNQSLLQVKVRLNFFFNII